MAASILVVEDEPAIQELIAVNLESAGHEVIRAQDAEAALAIVQRALPDLLLLDWTLPGAMSGVQFARRMRQDARTRLIPIIMVTARSAEHDMIAGLEAADDYITKPFSPRELVARVRAVLRRRAPQTTDDPIELAGLRIEPATRRVFANNVPLDLGPTEFRLLHFLMTHPERVHSRSQVLDRVWGDHVFVAERTVDVHVRRLRQSLAGTGHDRLVQTVRGSGYRLTAHDA